MYPGSSSTDPREHCYCASVPMSILSENWHVSFLHCLQIVSLEDSVKCSSNCPLRHSWTTKVEPLKLNLNVFILKKGTVLAGLHWWLDWMCQILWRIVFSCVIHHRSPEFLIYMDKAKHQKCKKLSCWSFTSQMFHLIFNSLSLHSVSNCP